MLKILSFGKKKRLSRLLSLNKSFTSNIVKCRPKIIWGGIMLPSIKGAIHVKMNLCGFKDGLLILPPTLIFHFGGTPETEGTSLYVWIRQSVSQSVS